MTDCRKEFPTEWFARAKLCSECHDPKPNYFNVNKGQAVLHWAHDSRTP